MIKVSFKNLKRYNQRNSATSLSPNINAIFFFLWNLSFVTGDSAQEERRQNSTVKWVTTLTHL